MTAAPFARITHSCVKCSEPVALSEAYTARDGVMDHKLVLVARNQADRLLQQISQLGNNSTIVRPFNDQLVSFD
jgi:hypothetical protein